MNENFDVKVLGKNYNEKKITQRTVLLFCLNGNGCCKGT